MSATRWHEHVKHIPTLETYHFEMSLLNDVTPANVCECNKQDGMNMPNISHTLRTHHFEMSLLNDVAPANVCDRNKMVENVVDNIITHVRGGGYTHTWSQCLTGQHTSHSGLLHLIWHWEQSKFLHVRKIKQGA